MRFQVGDRVGWWTDTSVAGTIVSVSPGTGCPYNVRWDNGTNGDGKYRYPELEMVLLTRTPTTYDHGPTNPAGFPTMPTEPEPAPPVASADPSNGIRVGDLVEWEVCRSMVVGVVEEIEDAHLYARRKLDGKTVRTCVCTAHCAVVTRREDL